MNKAEELFEKIGFWNMPCVQISLKNYIKSLKKN